MVRPARRPHRDSSAHPPGTAAGGARRETVERDVPATTLSMAFHMGSRTSQDFYTADLVSDLLSGGDSSRLYKHLVQEQRLLASVNAYISGDIDPGLFEGW